MGTDSFLYVLTYPYGKNLSDTVEERCFVHEGGEVAYFLGRTVKDLPFNRNVGEFVGKWSFKQTAGRLFALIMDGDRKVQTTAQYEAALEDLASSGAEHLRGSIPYSSLELEATKNAFLNKLKTEMASVKPYLQANDMILQLKGSPRGIERNFLRFAAGGSYPADAEISGVFDAFQKAQRK